MRIDRSATLRIERRALSGLPMVLACRSAGAGLVVDPPSDGRLVVRGPAEGGGWVRVLHARTLTLLALAPLLPEGRGVRADILVPLDLDLVDLRIDRTDRPLPDPATGADLVHRARELGRAAAGQAAVGNLRRADELWDACARAWLEADDTTRAEAARANIRRT
ncbi:MAG: hypothetical protein FJW83_01475 [Actinobacteria bacterium]|nr:hypothetical protein [Actinomycetota bacterium]